MATGKQESTSLKKQESEQYSDSNLAHSISEQFDSSLVLHDSACHEETTKKNQSNNTPSDSDSNCSDAAEEEEDDHLLFDVPNKYWDLPQPSKEIQRLKKFCPVVHIEQDEYNEWCKPWNTALIITILEKKFDVYHLKEHLSRIWGIPEFEIIDLGNNYFSIRFTDTENWAAHYKKVLLEGPWVVSQYCVLVQRWTPYFDPSQNPRRRIATWIRIPRIPLHYYNKHFISKLGDRIGNTLKIDLNTLSDYSARIFVEINLQKELVPRLIAANEIFNVEYEELEFICIVCGRYGHGKENCPKFRF